ncbi:MAG: hypothetical protein AB1458_15170, partial [Bacteroidota bacterium]
SIDLERIQNPKLYDIYKIEVSSNHYTTAILMRMHSDTFMFMMNRRVFQKQDEFYTTQSEDYIFRKIFTKKELISLQEKDIILDVERKLTDFP